MNLQKKATRWAKICGRLPGVRAIFLSGSVATGMDTPQSDIDFFVVAKFGQIWTARFGIFVILKIAGQLAKPHRHAGKICPNHFIADRALMIREQDAYAARLFSKNKPIFDPDNVFPHFLQINRNWITDFGEKVPSISDKKIDLDCHETGWCGKLVERILRAPQVWRIKKNTEYQCPRAVIVLDDDELRFHPTPKNRVPLK